MANTYYDSELTGEEIEAALEAIDGVVTTSNNGKVLAVEDGKIVAKSASEWTDTPVLEPLSVTENGDYTPPAGVAGFNAVSVNVSSGVQILTKTVTGTTNDNGNFRLDLTSAAASVLSVTVASHDDTTVSPIVCATFGRTRSSNALWAHCTIGDATGAPLANTNVTLRVVYIER